MILDEVIAATVRDLEHELVWFQRLLDLRLRRYFSPADAAAAVGELPDIGDLPPPEHGGSPSLWACFLRDHPLTFVVAAAQDAVTAVKMLAMIRVEAAEQHVAEALEKRF